MLGDLISGGGSGQDKKVALDAAEIKSEGSLSFPVGEMRAQLKRLGLPSSGSREQLWARLQVRLMRSPRPRTQRRFVHSNDIQAVTRSQVKPPVSGPCGTVPIESTIS